MAGDGPAKGKDGKDGKGKDGKGKDGKGKGKGKKGKAPSESFAKSTGAMVESTGKKQASILTMMTMRRLKRRPSLLLMILILRKSPCLFSAIASWTSSLRRTDAEQLMLFQFALDTGRPAR